MFLAVSVHLELTQADGSSQRFLLAAELLMSVFFLGLPYRLHLWHSVQIINQRGNPGRRFHFHGCLRWWSWGNAVWCEHGEVKVMSTHTHAQRHTHTHAISQNCINIHSLCENSFLWRVVRLRSLAWFFTVKLTSRDLNAPFRSHSHSIWPHVKTGIYEHVCWE